MADFKTFQKISVIIAIAILLNVFVNYGRQVFYPEPRYDKFCNTEPILVDNKDNCEKNNGKWISVMNEKSPEMIQEPKAAPNYSNSTIKSYCDMQYYCSKDFQKALAGYNKNVFIAYLAFGLILVIIGLAITNSSSVSLGILYGGIILIFIGTTRFWPEMTDIFRFGAIGFVLAVFLWIGYKKLK